MKGESYEKEKKREPPSPKLRRGRALRFWTIERGGGARKEEKSCISVFERGSDDRAASIYTLKGRKKEQMKKKNFSRNYPA